MVPLYFSIDGYDGNIVFGSFIKINKYKVEIGNIYMYTCKVLFVTFYNLGFWVKLVYLIFFKIKNGIDIIDRHR